MQDYKLVSMVCARHSTNVVFRAQQHLEPEELEVNFVM